MSVKYVMLLLVALPSLGYTTDTDALSAIKISNADIANRTNHISLIPPARALSAESRESNAPVMIPMMKVSQMFLYQHSLSGPPLNLRCTSGSLLQHVDLVLVFLAYCVLDSYFYLLILERFML